MNCEGNGKHVQMGDCRRECVTMARICSDLIGEYDMDLSELLYKPGTTRSQVTNALCYDLSGYCRKKPPPFTGSRPDGEDFLELDDTKLKLKRMVSSMTDQGMSGNVRSHNIA